MKRIKIQHWLVAKTIGKSDIAVRDMKKRNRQSYDLIVDGIKRRIENGEIDFEHEVALHRASLARRSKEPHPQS